MPKIIKDLKQSISNEAKKQLLEMGYAKTTIRSVANSCGIGVGTIYNYYSSKDQMISSFMLDDWHICIDEMREIDIDDKLAFMQGIYDALHRFIIKYEFLFHDPEAKKVFTSVFSARHSMLKQILIDLIMPVLEEVDYCDRAFLADYLAESIIHWSMTLENFDMPLSIIEKLV